VTVISDLDEVVAELVILGVKETPYKLLRWGMSLTGRVAPAR
jgi:hypothetical protein